MTEHRIPIELLDRVLAGEATAAEQASVRAALVQHANDGETVEQMLGRWQAQRVTDLPTADEVARDHARLLAVIDAKRSRALRVPRWLGGVAGLIAAVVLMILGHNWYLPKTIATDHTFTTRTGQRAVVTLLGGARVTLAPMTRLDVHRGGMLELVGEAYFEVPHATAIPIVVRTGRVTTRVLGTAFDVRRYADDSVTRVTVTSGKISIGHHRLVTVTAGALARATDSTVTVIPNGAAMSPSWTGNQLVFRDTPVADLLETVGRWYDVRFHIADSVLARRKMTTTVDFTSTSELLQTLSLVLDVTMIPDTATHTITIRPRRNTQATTPRWRHDATPSTTISDQEIGR